MTPNWLKVWWLVYNDSVFGGALRPGQIRLADLVHCGEYMDGVITISSSNSTPELMRATLVHEMVHQWQDQNNVAVGHGATFKTWQDMILATMDMEI